MNEYPWNQKPRLLLHELLIIHFVSSKLHEQILLVYWYRIVGVCSRYAGENTRVTTLYDSVAAELRAKLGKKNSPILLPPRDYDTVHRTKGNLTGIELRRCLNANIVGQNVKARRIESSGGSSGIGSDHPPSPESPDAPDSRFNTLDNQSTSGKWFLCLSFSCY